MPTSAGPSVAGTTPGYDEYTLLSRLRSLYNQARDEKRRSYDTWRRNYLLLNNKMWSDFRTNWMPAPTDSEVLPIVSSAEAWMTDQHIEFTIIPASDPNQPFNEDAQKRANDLSNVLHSNYEQQNWGRPVGLCIRDSLTYGTGILKCVWDQTLDVGIGNVDMRRVNPWEFYPDPNATDDQDGSYYFEVRRMSMDEIERRFPDTFPKLLEAMVFGGDDDTDSPPKPNQTRSRPFANPSLLPSPANTPGSYGLPGQGRIQKGDAAVLDSLNVYECWFRENIYADHEEAEEKIANENSPQESLVYDAWRCVVYAGGAILFDELAEELYNFNTHPYCRYVFEEQGEFWGNALVGHLAPCQIAINRILASVQQNVELTGNPVFLDVDNSGINRAAMTNRPGERLTVRGQAAQQNQRPGWLTPPSMPPNAMETVQFWIDRMKNISGLSDVSRGQTPPGRNAAQTIQGTQESGFVRIRKGQRNLEYTLRRAGTLLATLIIENYTTPRMVAIVGDSNGTQSSLTLAAHHFYTPGQDGMEALRYQLLVNAGSDNPTSRQARIAEADTLYALGAITQRALLQAHNYPNLDAIIKEKKEEQFQAAALGQSSGPGSRAATKRKT